MTGGSINVSLTNETQLTSFSFESKGDWPPVNRSYFNQLDTSSGYKQGMSREVMRMNSSRRFDRSCEKIFSGRPEPQHEEQTPVVVSQEDDKRDTSTMVSEETLFG